jgi:hypothetical protein
MPADNNRNKDSLRLYHKLQIPQRTHTAYSRPDFPLGFIFSSTMIDCRFVDATIEYVPRLLTLRRSTDTWTRLLLWGTETVNAVGT